MRKQIVRRRAISSPLLAYRANVTSQFGEDGILVHLLARLRPRHNYCVEFGAWDGRNLSNCYNLLAHNGWAGLMIEASAAKFAQLQETYRGNERVTLVNGFVEVEGPNSLDNMLERCGAPREPAVLSIDIDGNDYYVWESLKAYQPDIVVIEFNPTVPNDVIFVQACDPGVNQGCSLAALIELGKSKGYELAVCTLVNAIFVRAEVFPSLGIADNSIDAMYAPPQDGRIFQGYDGSIHVVGMDSLFWRPNVTLSDEDFQVLPRAMRVWSDVVR